jgi:hypothetical protein
MLGSVVRVVVEVGDVEMVGAEVVAGEDVAVLELDAADLLPSPHPASSIDAASGTASSAAAVLFTVLPTPSFSTSLCLQRRCEPSATMTTLGSPSDSR